MFIKLNILSKKIKYLNDSRIDTNDLLFSFNEKIIKAIDTNEKVTNYTLFSYSKSIEDLQKDFKDYIDCVGTTKILSKKPLNEKNRDRIRSYRKKKDA